MTEGLYRQDPLTPEEREEFEDDLVSFSDRGLDGLGDVSGLEVLYAGGSSLLWVEGLSQRVGEHGSVTALDADEERVEATRENLADADLPAPVRLVAGDVFRPPFGPGSFDLVYSAGLFHELDVSERTAEEALLALASVVRPGGRVATEDFVDTVPAAQLEDEKLDADLALASSGESLIGIGAPGRIVALHEGVLSDVWWRVSRPFRIRHLDKVVLAEPEPADLPGLPPEVAQGWRRRREALRERVGREGYTRPATVYVEGTVAGGRR
ncbi:class I SAM-dependent methyltransferase [Rubrobacter tropicus]|nr:class I SAM-dependent methyltransferase [Rubrobacter tropicus]